jgi:hypothetical protein
VFRPRSRYGYRRSLFHGRFRRILRAIELACLFHLRGAGGSPFGLLLLAAFVLWLAARTGRRRRAHW